MCSVVECMDKTLDVVIPNVLSNSTAYDDPRIFRYANSVALVLVGEVFGIIIARKKSKLNYCLGIIG